jgi:hypothetical protein
VGICKLEDLEKIILAFKKVFNGLVAQEQNMFGRQLYPIMNEKVGAS